MHPIRNNVNSNEKNGNYDKSKYINVIDPGYTRGSVALGTYNLTGAAMFDDTIIGESAYYDFEPDMGGGLPTGFESSNAFIQNEISLAWKGVNLVIKDEPTDTNNCFRGIRSDSDRKNA